MPLAFLPPHRWLLFVATTRLYASAPFPGNIKSAWCPIFSFHASPHLCSPSLSSLLGHVGFLKSVAFLQQSITLCSYSPIIDPCSFSLAARHAPLMGRCIRSLSHNLTICRSQLQSTFTEGAQFEVFVLFQLGQLASLSPPCGKILSTAFLSTSALASLVSAEYKGEHWCVIKGVKEGQCHTTLKSLAQLSSSS